MFAPKVAKALTKPAANSTRNQVRQRSTVDLYRVGRGRAEDVRLLQRAIGNQATLRILERFIGNPPGNERIGPRERAVGEAVRQTPGALWDFNRIPAFASNSSRPDRRAHIATSPLPAVVAAKLEIGANGKGRLPAAPQRIGQPCLHHAVPRVLSREIQREPDDTAKVPAASGSAPPTPRALDADAPWDQVWIGDSNIIGQVTEEGVAARIILSYRDLNITRSPEAQTYHCGKHDRPPIPTLVARMRKAAKQAAALNDKIPQQNYALKTALIAIARNANSAFRVSGGQGVLVVKQEEPWEGTIAHEGSHGIFAFHLGDRVPHGAPDPLAKGIAELFLALKDTTVISIPRGKFDPKHPPPLKDDGRSESQAAGILMVTDILWSGSGGHPGDNVDEFFASAFGGFQQGALFEQIVQHYGKADARIPPLAKRLLALLAKVADPNALAALKAPADTKAIDAEIRRIAPTPEVIAGFDAAVDLLVNPDKLPGPRTISCPGGKPSGTGTAGKAKPASNEATGP